MSREQKFFTAATILVVAGGPIMAVNVVVGGVIIAIGLIALLLGLRVKQAKPSYQESKKEETIPSRREALESAKVAWGLWHTGTRMRIDLLLEVESLKRVLLLEPNAQNPSLRDISTKSKNPVDWIIVEIVETTNAALDNGIDVRWYFTARESALTIYDTTPVEDKPCSKNALMYVEYFVPGVGVDQRKRHIIHNSGKDKKRFAGYYKEYEDIWNDSSKSMQAYRTDMGIQNDNYGIQPIVISDSPKIARAELHFTGINCKFIGDNPPLLLIQLDVMPTGNMYLEQAEIEILGRKVPFADWKPETVSPSVTFGFTNHCEIKSGLSIGNHDIRILVYANREWWASDWQTITYSPSVPDEEGYQT